MPKRGGLWAAVTVLYVLVAAIIAFDFWGFKDHNLRLISLSAMLDSMSGFGHRLDSVEQKLQVWANYQDGLAAKVNKLQVRVNLDYKRAQKQTLEQIARARQEILGEVDSRTGRLDARLSGLEASEQADRARVAQLGEDVAAVRREIAEGRDATGRDLAALRRAQNQSQAWLETLSHQVDRRRVDFEASKGEERNLTPEISISVSATDLRYQLYSGWLWYEPDQQTIWIVDQGIQQPVVFRSRQNSQSFELVVTNVNKNGVAGYLLLPVGEAPIGKASAHVEREKSAESAGQ